MEKPGIGKATSNGPSYLPVYLFGPYKLLTMIAGVTISLFWTIFPSPASARSQARRSLGHGLFILAKFYSCMHKAVKMWINERQGDMNAPKSPGRQLNARSRFLFFEQTALLAQTQSHIHWTSCEIPLGRRYPRSSYLSAASNMQQLTTCMALVTHATRAIDLSVPNSSSNPASRIPASEHDAAPIQEKWIHQLARATESSNFDAHMTTSLLCQLSGAILSNSALPPYLSAPDDFSLSKRLRDMNAQAMRMENVRDTEFSAFACIEVAISMVSRRLTDLIDIVKDLVGEINFDMPISDEKTKREKALCQNFRGPVIM